MRNVALHSRLTLGSLAPGPRIRHAAVLSAIRQAEALNGQPFLRALDAGSADGALTFHIAHAFPRLQITGIELFPELVVKAEHKQRVYGISNAHFAVGSILEPLPDTPYDLIWCADVLEHIEDDRGVIENLSTGLRSGGFLVIHVPLYPRRHFIKSLESYHQDDHVREGYTKDELWEKLESAGFHVCGHRYTFGPFGALAWDMETTGRRFGKAGRMASMPFVLPLTWFERHSHNDQGNSICMIARK